MKPRCIYIHGNDSEHWSFGWAASLKNQLESLGFETFFETMPDSIIARSEYWLPFLQDHVKAGSGDLLIGWSSGAVAAMRYAETHTILGSVLVSPCYTDLGDALEKQSGYYDIPWDWGAIKAHQKNIALIWGDDAPFIPQAEFSYIAEQLKPILMPIHHGKHFIERSSFPELLEYIKQIYL